MDKSSTKKCIACKSAIDIEATLCPICSSYQRNWRNNLKYWLPFAGFVVLLFPIITYMCSAVPRTFGKDNIKILSFDGNRIAVSNEGYGDVYLSHVFIKSDEPLLDISYKRNIAKTLEVDDILRLKVKPYKRWIKGTSTSGVKSVPGDKWKDLLKRSEDRKDKCFYPIFYLKDGATITILKSETENLPIFNGHGVLDFYSARKRRYFKKRFDLYGTIIKNNSDDCVQRE